MLFKKELSQIPVLPIPALDEKEKKNNGYYIAAAEKVSLPRSGEILVVDFLVKDSKTLKVRFFCDGKNFLSCKEWPAKSWTEQNPRMSLGYNNIDYRKADEKMVSEYLHIDCTWRSMGVLGLVDDFCTKRQREYREKRERRAYELQQEHFTMFPPLPDNLREYCEEHVFDHGYIFIAPKGKDGRREGFCGQCGEHFDVDAQPGKMGFCPKCGKAVLYRGLWNKHDISEKKQICIAHKVKNQLLLRWTNVYRSYKWPECKCEYEFEDYAYNLHLITKEGPKTYFYKYISRYGYGYDWYRGHLGDYCYDSAYIYTDNLDAVFGDRYYNVNLKAGLEGMNTKIQFAVLLNNLKNNPAAEYLFKLGMTNLAEKSQYLCCNGKGFAGVLRVSAQLEPLYRTMNVTLSEHRVIQGYGRWVTPEELAAYRALGEITDTDPVIQLIQSMSFGKFVRYFQKQREANPKKKIGYLISRYRDYIDMSVGLKVDLSHKSVRFPADCLKAHDQILARYNAKKHEIENATFAEAVQRLYAALRVREYEKGGYCIVLPQMRSDLITEGQSLNHCVGGDGYYQRHIKGERMIFFVRKAEAREKPFFTMELDMANFKILQLYGFGDCSAPKDVRKFAEGFAKALAVPAKSDRMAS